MLDLAYLRKRLPRQLAQMSDEQLEVYRLDMYALANLAIDYVMKKKALPKEGDEPRER